MSRPVFFLLVLAALACLAPVPLFLSGDDEDAPARNIKAQATWARPALFTRLSALSAVRIEPVRAEPSSVGPLLASLDRAFDDSVRKCAPEMWGYDREWLHKLQGDWLQMKPNMVPAWEAWLSLNGVVIDEERVAECKGILSGDDCELMREVWDPCTRPFTGALGGGERCETGEQCASGRCLDNACAALEGSCRKRAECGDDMVCARDEDGLFACVPAPGEGDRCRSDVYDEDQLIYVDVGCAAGMKCSDSRTCARPRAIGESCDLNTPCGDDAFCSYADEAKAICVAEEEIREGADDESCTCDPERDGKYCVANDEGIVQCKPAELVQLGERCDESRICADSLGVTACIDGRCQRALSHGDACSDHDQCKDDLVCIVGACTPPLHAGEPCSDMDDCIFGLDCVANDEGETLCDVFKSVDESDERIIHLSDLHVDLIEDVPDVEVEFDDAAPDEG